MFVTSSSEGPQRCGVTLTDRRAHVVGLGLIGASVALALRDAGWTVSGEDVRPEVMAEALEAAIVAPGEASTAQLIIIATPAGAVAEVAQRLLRSSLDPTLLITDVAGVKHDIVHAVSDPRFIGGHPMAGSELRGIRGARPDLFHGCTWILTPTGSTAPETYSRLHGYLRELGAAVVAISADDHDRLVALASHVPHVLAGALMNQATDVAKSDAVLLQLAAGGFRDMTRIAAGDPTIWPDILLQNRVAITLGLNAIESRLRDLRSALDREDRSFLEQTLAAAADARRQLPGRALRSEDLAYLRVPMPDQPGVLADITMVASDLLVNIYDIEIAHGVEGERGTLLLAIDRGDVPALTKVLTEKHYLVAVDH